MKKRLAAIIVVCAAIVLVVPVSAADFHRGVSIHNMMNWAQTAPGSQIYASHPFSGPDYDVPDELLSNIAASGMDFIRLTVDPGPFLAFKGSNRANLDALLVSNIKRITGYGLGVVINFHPISQVEKFSGKLIIEDEHNGLFDEYVAMVGHTAALISGIDLPRVAIEPFNEPPRGYNDADVVRWGRMLKRIHDAVRTNAPDMILIVSGARGGGLRGLLDLDPAPLNDSRTLFSFHYYEPHIFTHQAVQRSRKSPLWYLRYLSSVPYPAGSGSAEAVWQGALLAIEADGDLTAGEKLSTIERLRKEFDAYVDSGWNRKNIEADFDKVVEWAQRNHIPNERIFVGEFGVRRTYGRYTGADPVSRAAWLTDVRKAAEERGFAWAIWHALGYGGMAIVDHDETSELHVPTLRALGLSQ